MRKSLSTVMLVFSLNLALASMVLGQSEDTGNKLLREGQDIQHKAQSSADVDRAIKKYEEALKIFETRRALRGQAVALNNIGWAQYKLSRYGPARDNFERSIQLSRKSGEAKEEGNTLSNLGLVLWKLGDFPAALEHFQLSLQIRKRIGDTRGEGICLNNLGLVYDNSGEYPKALEAYEQALKLYRKIGENREEGITLNNLGLIYSTLGQYAKALEYYQQSLPLRRKTGDVFGEGVTLNNIGLVNQQQGQYAKALDNYLESIRISEKIGNRQTQGVTLSNIGLIYYFRGQYSKALEYFQQALEMNRKLGDVKQEGITLGNVGKLYSHLGQYSRGLEYYERSYKIREKIGDTKGRADALGSIAYMHAQQGNYDEAIKAASESLEIKKRIGVPIKVITDNIANYYIDTGNMTMAEPLAKQSGYYSTQGRIALMKSDYSSAVSYFTKDAEWAEKTGNTDALFRSYTGLGRAYESLEDYKKSEEYYSRAVKVIEEIRSALVPSERKNFFDVKVGGFQRSDPAKGLTRVRMKLNLPDGSIASSEVTRARSFAEHLAENSSGGSTGITRDSMEKEQSLVNRVAALKKELAQTDREKQPAKFDTLSTDIKTSERELANFIDDLWKKYPAYAAVKYPRPVSLKESALKPEEYVVMFDVSSEGVGMKLIRNKKIYQTFYTEWPQDEIEKDVKKFRQPLEKLKFREFDVELASKLYNRLLLRVLVDVPKGTPLIIIPDGILATLPFEALVTGGVINWGKAPLEGYPDQLRDNPEGVRFLVEDHPVSYYQSITALTLARTLGRKERSKNRTLVIADPVFSMQDARAQQATTQTRLAETEKQQNIELMRAMEEEGQNFFVMKRLPRTSQLADGLEQIYGDDCVSLTGLKANKPDFMNRIAPKIDSYSNIVFATHGVMSTRIPGLMEPFLALTMCPPGTDGFLKMSDILSLKMNADVVALTACQTGLGKDVSGEGVMSMGRAFQYSGAKSVLMTLWEVEEASAIKLTERFFQHRKDGKTKLEALQAARDDIRKEGYKHPYFWSGFILVGETS